MFLHRIDSRAMAKQVSTNDDAKTGDRQKHEILQYTRLREPTCGDNTARTARVVENFKSNPLALLSNLQQERNNYKLIKVED